MDDLRTTAVGGCVSAPGINPGLSLGVGIPRMGSSNLCSPNPMTADGSFFPNSSTQFQQSFHGNVSSNQAYVHVYGYHCFQNCSMRRSGYLQVQKRSKTDRQQHAYTRPPPSKTTNAMQPPPPPPKPFDVLVPPWYMYRSCPPYRVSSDRSVLRLSIVL